MYCENCHEDPCRGPREPSNKNRFKVGQLVRPTKDALELLSTRRFKDEPQTVTEIMPTRYCGTTGQHIKTDKKDDWVDAYWFEETKEGSNNDDVRTR